MASWLIVRVRCVPCKQLAIHIKQRLSNEVSHNLRNRQGVVVWKRCMGEKVHPLCTH